VGVTARHQTVQGISFPITKDAEQALLDYKEEVISHIELVSSFGAFFGCQVVRRAVVAKTEHSDSSGSLVQTFWLFRSVYFLITGKN